MAVEFLSDQQGAQYAAFNGAPSRAELERYFFLEEDGREEDGGEEDGRAQAA